MARRRILSIGTDDQLLVARNSILAAAGYEVAIARNRYAAILALCSVRFDIVILCWTVAQEDRDKLVHDVEIVQPKAAILRLEDPGPATVAEADDATLLTTPGPNFVSASAMRKAA